MFTVTYNLVAASPLGNLPAQGRIVQRNQHRLGALVHQLTFAPVGTAYTGSFVLKPGTYYLVVGNTYAPFVVSQTTGSGQLTSLLETPQVPL